MKCAWGKDLDDFNGDGAAWTATRREGTGLDLYTPDLTPLGANKGGNSLAGAIPAAITANVEEEKMNDKDDQKRYWFQIIGGYLKFECKHVKWYNKSYICFPCEQEVMEKLKTVFGI